MTTALDEADKPFFIVPAWLWSWQPPAERNTVLSRADRYLWGMIRDYPAQHDGRAPTLADLAALTGEPIKAMRWSAEKLERAELVTGERPDDPLRGPRDRRATRYRVRRPNVTPNGTLGTVQRDAGGHVNVPKTARQRDAGGHVNVTLDGTHKEQRQTYRQQTGAAAGECRAQPMTPWPSGKAEVVRLLVGQGIDVDVAESEARRDGLTPELVKAGIALADARRGVNNRAGFILDVLRKRPAELVQRAAALRREAEERAGAEREACEVAEARAIVASIRVEHPGEWAAVVEAAKASLLAARWKREQLDHEFKLAAVDVAVLPPAIVVAVAAAWKSRPGATTPEILAGAGRPATRRGGGVVRDGRERPRASKESVAVA